VDVAVLKEFEQAKKGSGSVEQKDGELADGFAGKGGIGIHEMR
jgi:hypothetical protein